MKEKTWVNILLHKPVHVPRYIELPVGPPVTENFKASISGSTSILNLFFNPKQFMIKAISSPTDRPTDSLVD